MKTELTEQDKQRIQQEACNQIPHGYQYWSPFIRGAEYEHNYQREQLIKYKDAVEVFNIELTKEVNLNKQLEAERSELRNKAEEYRRLLLRAEMYVLPTEQTNGLISDIRNSLKTKP